ncbi:MAG: hypothetical protein IJG32_07565 [Selenomonadaceae bacterium]|nr:hypothetical protein [Selenomonadaceae bacterium]
MEKKFFFELAALDFGDLLLKSARKSCLEEFFLTCALDFGDLPPKSARKSCLEEFFW